MPAKPLYPLFDVRAWFARRVYLIRNGVFEGVLSEAEWIDLDAGVLKVTIPRAAFLRGFIAGWDARSR